MNKVEATIGAMLKPTPTYLRRPLFTYFFSIKSSTPNSQVTKFPVTVVYYIKLCKKISRARYTVRCHSGADGGMEALVWSVFGVAVHCGIKTDQMGFQRGFDHYAPDIYHINT